MGLNLWYTRCAVLQLLWVSLSERCLVQVKSNDQCNSDFVFFKTTYLFVCLTSVSLRVVLWSIKDNLLPQNWDNVVQHPNVSVFLCLCTFNEKRKTKTKTNNNLNVIIIIIHCWCWVKKGWMMSIWWFFAFLRETVTIFIALVLGLSLCRLSKKKS